MDRRNIPYKHRYSCQVNHYCRGWDRTVPPAPKKEEEEGNIIITRICIPIGNSDPLQYPQSGTDFLVKGLQSHMATQVIHKEVTKF